MFEQRILLFVFLEGCFKTSHVLEKCSLKMQMSTGQHRYVFFLGGDFIHI